MSKPRKKEFFVKGVIAFNIISNKTSNFKSVKEASNNLGILETAIHNNIAGKSKTTTSKKIKQKYKFTWDKNIS